MTKLALGGACVVATALLFWYWRAPLPVAAPLALFLIVHLVRSADGPDVDAFARTTGLETTPASRDLIGRHITRGRRRRVLAVAAAVAIPCVLALVAPGLTDGRVVVNSGILLGAYALGTLWADLSIARPAGEAGQARAASLVPREPVAYLSRSLRWGPAVAGALGALAWLGTLQLDRSGDSSGGVPHGADIAAGVAIGLAVPLLAAVAQRVVLRRPQPLVSPDLVAADDALRAASVQNLTAVSCCIVLLNLVSGLYWHVLLDHDTPLRWPYSLGIVAGTLLAVASWTARRVGGPVRRQPFALPVTGAPVTGGA